MNKAVYTYEKKNQHVLENLFKNDQLLMNHVIVEPGQVFPKHPTDADVYITILSGTLSIALEEGAFETHTVGEIVHVKKGTQSSLGNKGDQVLQMIVTKYKFD